MLLYICPAEWFSATQFRMVILTNPLKFDFWRRCGQEIPKKARRISRAQFKKNRLNCVIIEFHCMFCAYISITGHDAK